MQQRKKIIKKNKLKFNFLAMLFIVQVIFLIFNDVGLIKLIQLQNAKSTLHSNVQGLLNQQIKLQDEIIELETNEEYIEKIARERFMMVRPGEKVFRVIDVKTAK